MAKATPGRQVEAALGVLTGRALRAQLYNPLVGDIDGLDPATYPVLSGLARIGPVSASRLGELIGFDRTVTTRYASRLEAAGLLARSRDPRDARATLLELTPAGRAAASTVRRQLVGAIEEVLADWPKRDAERFAVALEKFAEGMRRR
jgi:DNA-binding MarR family transcriptional regulator